ncbi:MAG TPA: hypothetical protein VK151_00885 [Fluviicola sp.]|nr:hypothetical protein [Fluviicola sp.]
MEANHEKKRIHTEKTIKSFSYSVLGTILPMLLATLPVLLFNNSEKLWKFFDEGEVLLFGAGLFTSALFLFGENKPSIKKTVDKILSNLSLWLLIVCSAFYAILYTVEIFGEEYLAKINYAFVRCTSIVLFIVSMLAVYRSTFIEFKKVYTSVDVKKKSEAGVEGIMDQL